MSASRGDEPFFIGWSRSGPLSLLRFCLGVALVLVCLLGGLGMIRGLDGGRCGASPRLRSRRGDAAGGLGGRPPPAGHRDERSLSRPSPAFRHRDAVRACGAPGRRRQARSGRRGLRDTGRCLGGPPQAWRRRHAGPGRPPATGGGQLSGPRPPSAWDGGAWPAKHRRRQVLCGRHATRLGPVASGLRRALPDRRRASHLRRSVARGRPAVPGPCLPRRRQAGRCSCWT